MKYFRMSYEEVVYRRSYINLVLLNRAIPGIKPYEKNEEDYRVPEKIKRKKATTQHANDFFEQLM